jgi:hypothetical protein
VPVISLSYSRDLSTVMADQLMLFWRTFIVYFVLPNKNIRTGLKIQLYLMLKVAVPLNFKGLHEVMQRQRREVDSICYDVKTFKLSEYPAK